MIRVLKGSHSFSCTPRVHAFSFLAEAGTHLPTPEGGKAECTIERRRHDTMSGKRHELTDLNPQSTVHYTIKLKINEILQRKNNKKLRYCKEHSASVVLTWCTLL